MSKSRSKYIAFFDYFFQIKDYRLITKDYKSLIVLSAISGSISITWFATVIGATVRIADENFIIAFLISTGILKKRLKQHEIKIKSAGKLLS